MDYFKLRKGYNYVLGYYTPRISPEPSPFSRPGTHSSPIDGVKVESMDGNLDKGGTSHHDVISLSLNFDYY